MRSVCCVSRLCLHREKVLVDYVSQVEQSKHTESVKPPRFLNTHTHTHLKTMFYIFIYAIKHVEN